MRTVKWLFLGAIFLLPEILFAGGVCGTNGTQQTVFNPFTGKQDYVCVYAGGGSGGGSSTLAVDLGNVIISSPTAVINFSSASFTANQAPTGQSNIGINFSSVASQTDLLNYLSLSSATANYLTLSSATATYLQITSSTSLKSSPGGSDSNVQINHPAGTFYGDNGFQYDSSVSSVSITGAELVSGALSVNRYGSGNSKFSLFYDPSGGDGHLHIRRETGSTPNGGFQTETLATVNSYTGMDNAASYVIQVTTGGPGLTNRISIVNSNSTTAQMQFNENSNGIKLQVSSMTYLNGTSNPVLDWSLPNTLRLNTSTFSALNFIDLGQGPGVMHVVAISSNVVTAKVDLSTEVIGILPLSNMISSITVAGTLVAGTNITLTPGSGITTISASGTGGGATLPLPPGDTNYVWITTGAVQPGAFKISSGTIDQVLTVNGNLGTGGMSFFDRGLTINFGTYTVVGASQSFIVQGIVNGSTTPIFQADPALNIVTSSVPFIARTTATFNGAMIDGVGSAGTSSVSFWGSKGPGQAPQWQTPSGGSGTTIYAATSTASFPFGFSASTGVFTSTVTLGGSGSSNNKLIDAIEFGTDNVQQRYSMIASSRGADAATIDMRFYTFNGDVNGVQERMRISPAGNVGIMNQNPQYALDVIGAGNFTSSMTVLGNVNVGTATINGTTTINGFLNVNSSVTAPSTISNGLIVGGHIEVSSTTPVISACGSTPNGSVVGNDFAGKITIGGGVVTSCTMTFAATWANAPACTITSNTAITAATAATTTTALTLGAGATFNGDVVMYLCGGFR